MVTRACAKSDLRLWAFRLRASAEGSMGYKEREIFFSPSEQKISTTRVY